MKAPFCFFIAAMLFVSCSNEEPMPTPQAGTPGNPYKMDPEEAQSTVMEFLEAFDQSDLSRSAAPRRICNVKALRNSAAGTRAALGENALDLDTLMYVVNFSDSAGYALVAADKRTTPILALIESGNYDFKDLEQEENDGFLDFIEQAIHMEEDDIKSYEENGNTEEENTLTKNDTINPTRASSNDWTILQKVPPLLITKWDQGEKVPFSYGKYTPNKNVGCVPLAIAQICAYFKTPVSVTIGSARTGTTRKLDWERILSDCQKNNGKLSVAESRESMDEVAYLCHYLGVQFGVEYTTDHTSLSSKKEGSPISWMNTTRSSGGLRGTRIKDYNEREIAMAIIAGNPVYATGCSHKQGLRKYRGGHAWVYDGVLTAQRQGKGSRMFHCNWGWGGLHDGYFLSRVFKAKGGMEIPAHMVKRKTTTNTN